MYFPQCFDGAHNIPSEVIIRCLEIDARFAHGLELTKHPFYPFLEEALDVCTSPGAVVLLGIVVALAVGENISRCVQFSLPHTYRA